MWMPAPSPDLQALGLEIARHRREQGVSIDRLAEAAQVHRKSVIQIEAGRVSARISTLHAVAHALGIPLTELVAPVCRQHPEDLRTPTPIIER